MCTCKSHRIGGVVASVLASSVVDRGFIGGVVVSVLTTSVVDRGFIGGVVVSVLTTSAVDRGFIGGVVVSVLASSMVVGFLVACLACSPRCGGSWFGDVCFAVQYGESWVMKFICCF
ncbi:MAG: hypothetical protein H0A75_08760, partial [Candidatus Methanofishera endochildressiae]|nr:hypothetical protein [Candidatus Methanofishera endochildressiae]